MNKPFKSTHNLPFECATWIDEFSKFRIGTIEGSWRCTKDSYDILAIINSKPGNGHLKDVFDWFEQSCRRDNKCLRVLELWNKEFKQYLIDKKGFVDIGDDIVELKFN